MFPQVWPAILTLGWILFAIAIGELAMSIFALAAHDGHAPHFGISAVITATVAAACVLTTRGRQFELRFRDARKVEGVPRLPYVFRRHPAVPKLAAIAELQDEKRRRVRQANPRRYNHLYTRYRT